MMKLYLVLCFSIFTSIICAQNIVINELDCDSPGFDDKEFIELKSDVPNLALDGYVLVFFNGSSSGGNTSYFTIDLDGGVTDSNGLFVIASDKLTPFPQMLISESVIQNGADAVGLYVGSFFDFPNGTLATQNNLVDAMVYGTNDPEATGLLALLGETTQYNDNGTTSNPKSIQRYVDGMGNETFAAATPTPRQNNDDTSPLKALEISTTALQFDEGTSFDITFSTLAPLSSDYNFDFTLSNGDFDTSDFTGNLNLTLPAGQTSVSTTITLVDDTLDEGDEELKIVFGNLPDPLIPFNNFIIVRVVDNDFVVAPYGTPVNPTYGIVASTQPAGYYDSIDGLSGAALEQAIQDIIADPSIVRAQTYNDVIDILAEADISPENSNKVWLVYTEQSRPILDYQTGSTSTGKWNREHTFPRSLAGYFSIEADEIRDGRDIFWTTKADSLRHGNSDAHALRAADGPENSSRNNQHYGEYNGPMGNQGSFKGDVARSVLFLQLRYNGLSVVNGFPSVSGQMGDLTTLLDWHRNDPPDDFEMNRNNVVYTWQFNRNPLIDMPDLVEYIWGNNVGDVWNNSLSTPTFEKDNFVMYPNPASDKLYISGLQSQAKITIYSTEGRKVLSKNFSVNDRVVNLNLSSGLYLVNISTEKTNITKKLQVK
ncbi:endonuclease [Aurantibacter aestuarii]|uniref:Endonuclease I n=1 Tax=Aurantibacter aestuarii TaxID=1266046 RepID=A0A2T1NA30_9FLAO|nr:endonuclease [Aurantibacter aestuarii]PSG88731.1 endonuclease I [Aurantibacter aestuarii]